MTRKPRILVVEDEAAIRTGLLDVLVFHGYDVDAAENGTDGLAKALSGKFDLILLDVMLPGLDGFSVCNRIREQDREQAIIMLTAKTSDDDIIHGLSLGADDYVGKPFSVAQLILRIQAVLRRSGIDTQIADTLRLSDELEIDTRNLTAQCGDNTLSFTRREMDILQYLHRHHARPVPREELLNKIWGYAKHLDLETRTVDIHIAKLRRKLEPDPAQPRYLVTVRGAGYRLLVE
ncbi:MAG: response regulator [Gammaproteobacteria bacterium]|nr:response regulator [Gammaproteobacteria bacterium]